MNSPSFYVAVAALLYGCCGAVLARDAVTSVTATATPASYAGSCPTTLQFAGTIKLSRHPATVEYLWERSNGSRTPVKRIQVRSATQKVTDDWSIGGEPGTLKVWEKLTILSPNAISSATAKASVNCR